MVVELELLKGIPGYSMILKAILKTQIQLLVSRVFQIRRGNRDNIGVISHISPYTCFVTHH